MKKPSSIQETLDRCLADATAPEQLLSLALAKAAKRRNLSLPELEIQRLTTAILKAEGDTIQLDLDPPCSLGETEEEIQAAVQGLVDELNESLADVGDSVVEAISRAVPDALGKVAQIVGDHISEQAHMETLRHGYQQANSTVHGGALATLTRISLGAVGIDGTEAPPAYGCEVATNYAAASLSMMIAELCLDSENADLVAMSLVIHNCALKIREQVEQVQKKISGNSPRARLLMRKAAQREFRSKPRRTFRR